MSNELIFYRFENTRSPHPDTYYTCICCIVFDCLHVSNYGLCCIVFDCLHVSNYVICCIVFDCLHVSNYVFICMEVLDVLQFYQLT